MGCGASKTPPPQADLGLRAEAERIRAQKLANEQSAATSKSEPPEQRATFAVSTEPPPPALVNLIEQGNSLPDQLAGPYALDAYHANAAGAHRGFREWEGMRQWFSRNQALLDGCRSWGRLNLELPIDPEWMVAYGKLEGKGVQPKTIRPKLLAAKRGMVQAYEQAFASARSGSEDTFDRIALLPERRERAAQPAGGVLALYSGAICALPQLWELGVRAGEMSGEEGVELIWGLKLPIRLWDKLSSRYEGDLSRMTDCARLTAVFGSADGLEKAAGAVLESEECCSFRNRVAQPTSEGWRDLLFTIRCATGHLCELQMQIQQMRQALPQEQAVRVVKLCRRMLIAPAVTRDTYVGEVVDGEMRGEGGLNEAGEKEGMGAMVYASGDVYMGEWKEDQREGEGTYFFGVGE